MANNLWNGFGNWNGNPGDWSTGAAPGSGGDAIIQSGDDSLTAAGSADFLTILDGADLTLSTSAGALTVAGNIANLGAFSLDADGGDGGGHATLTGKLVNSGTITIGNSTLAASTTVSVLALYNMGSITLWGNSAAATTKQTTLLIRGAAPGALTGNVVLHGDALLEVGSGGFKSIAQGASLELDGSQARVATGAGTTNSALSGLAVNSGTLDIEGDSSNGAGGGTLTTTVALTNNGTLDLDIDGGDGGSKIAIGGALANSGEINVGSGSSLAITGDLVNAPSGDIVIGYGSVSSPTTVTAAGLSNSGSITVSGNSTLVELATLDLTGAAPSVLTGSVTLNGDSLLEVASGGVTSIGPGAELELEGSQARVAVGVGATSTALKGLASNYGVLDLEGDTGQSPGGATVATTVAFANQGTLDVDVNFGDGASSLAIGGTLTNAGTIAIGNSDSSGPTAVSATTLANSGSITLLGDDVLGTTHQATLHLTGAAPTAVTGTVILRGDALLEVGSGGFTSIGYGAELELEGSQARASVGVGATNSALKGLAANYGTFDIEGYANGGPGGEQVTTAALVNQGSLGVDASYGDGGSSLVIGGFLTNPGDIVIGNTDLGGNATGGASTTVTASNLINQGSVTLWGDDALGTADQTTLHLTGVVAGAVAGDVILHGDAMLEIGSGGFTSIGLGAELELDGSQARISIGDGATDSALAGLASNAGVFDIEGGPSDGGATVATTTGFNNNGTLEVDADSGDGGSSFSILGALTNTSAVVIGNTDLSSVDPYVADPTTVTATALANEGSITLYGGATLGTIEQATLDITGAVSGALTGDVFLHGDALLEVASGGFTSIGAGSELQLNGKLSRVSVGATAANSALKALATNLGTLDLEGGSNSAPGGPTVTTSVAMANYGALDVDLSNGDGGSSLSIAGALSNTGTLSIGNDDLAAVTLVTAGALVNNGSITLQGNGADLTGLQATLNVLAAAPTTTSGSIRVAGDALLEFKSGAITTIGAGSTFELDGAQARVSIGAGVSNSALNKLASNVGTLVLRGNSSQGYGYGGPVVSTTTGFANSGQMYVDGYESGDGGSSFTIAGALANSGALIIGNDDLDYCPGTTTIVTAAGLVNNGSIELQGNAASLSGYQATLDITAAAPTTTTGSIRVGGDGVLEFKSGGITTIGGGASFELDGAEAQATIAGGAFNSALTGLATNLGDLILRGGSSSGFGGADLVTTTAFTNDGVVEVDAYGYGDGGSTFTIGGALTNVGTFEIGNAALAAATAVTATGLTNSGLLTLLGEAGALGGMTISGAASNSGAITLEAGATMSIAGATTNTGAVNIQAHAKLAVTGAGHAYTQSGGTTTVAGTLAGAVNADGGVIDFTSALTSGDGTGATTVGDGGVLEFAAGVDSSHVATFTDNTGTLELGAPGSFAGTIKGYADGDVIDLLNTVVTGLSYSGQTLTVSGASGVLAHLLFTGSFTTASFTHVSDGHGGTDILDPPVAGGLAASSHALGVAGA